jgi:hypothetical protein
MWVGNVSHKRRIKAPVTECGTIDLSSLFASGVLTYAKGVISPSNSYAPIRIFARRQ